MITHKDQGYTLISLTPGTNPGQAGLPTGLDQNSMLWKPAAAEGYLPAFQKSLASQHSLVLHFQDTAARWNGSGMLSVHVSHIENYFGNGTKPSILAWAGMFRFLQWRRWKTSLNLYHSLVWLDFFRCLSQCDTRSFPLKTELRSDRLFWCSSWVQGGLSISLLLGTPLEAPHNTRPIGPCCWLPEEQL